MAIKKISRLVSSIEFEKIYMVRNKRISKGYDDREVSFLLGYRSLYVRDIENPTEKLRYTPTDTNLLQRIFDCQLPAIMPAKIAERYYTIQIVTVTNEPDQTLIECPDSIDPDTLSEKKTVKRAINILSHDIYLVGSGNQLIPLLFFTPGSEDYNINFNSFQDVQDINDEIGNLFNNGYFIESKTALEVFEHCIKRFDKAIRPCHIKEGIGYYSGKRKAPRLVKGRNKMGRETYSTENLS